MSKEKPILFSGPMVRAILSGQKTVTRRPVKGMALQWLADGFEPGFVANPDNAMCPYGQPGDRMWVREAWACIQIAQAPGEEWVVYREGDNRTDFGGPWKPSIHMRRRDSRILLEITAVRVERLQGISEEQARAEGITDGGCHNCGNHEPCGCECPTPSAVDSFVHLWNSTGGDWDVNPWVWVVEFKRVMP
jgi:hypothetical protein